MLIVVLGLALYGVVAGLGHWASSEDDALGYSTERMVEAAYHAPARTAYTPSAAGNSAVAVPMSDSRGTLFRHTYVPAANYTVSTPMFSGGAYAAQGLMLTSQQRPQSYGGSGSAMGTSSSTRTGMAGGSTGGSSYAMGGYASSGSALGGTYIYSTPAGGGISVNGNMTSTFSPSVYASAPAPYASFNNDFGAWGKAFNTPFVSASEPQTAVGSSWIVSHAANRRYAPPSGDTPYLNWLKNQGESAYLYSDDKGVRYYDINKLREIYEQQFGGTDTPEITWEEFLSWFNSYEYVGVPLSDGCSLMLLLAAGLALYIRKKTKCTRSADISR